MTYVSLDRYKRTVREVFNVLRQHPDGLTANELAKIMYIQRAVLNALLENNLLFYVDRWTVTRSKALCRVWMAAKLDNPGDCPPPDNLDPR